MRVAGEQARRMFRACGDCSAAFACARPIDLQAGQATSAPAAALPAAQDVPPGVRQGIFRAQGHRAPGHQATTHRPGRPAALAAAPAWSAPRVSCPPPYCAPPAWPGGRRAGTREAGEGAPAGDSAEALCQPQRAPWAPTALVRSSTAVPLHVCAATTAEVQHLVMRARPQRSTPSTRPQWRRMDSLESQAGTTPLESSRPAGLEAGAPPPSGEALGHTQHPAPRPTNPMPVFSRAKC